jgi:O-antigen/teichoic acid export membrane protein
MIAKMLREYLTALDQRYHFTQALKRRLTNRVFWRNTGLLLLANLIVMGLGIIRTPLMTWVLPKNEIGMLGVVASWLPFLQLASLSGMDGATFHYVSKGQPWAFVSALFLRFRWSLLSAAGFLGGAVYWATRGEITLAWLFVITGISYPLTIGMTASAGMLAAQERYKGLFWYRIFESLTDFTGFIPLALTAFWISKVVTFYLPPRSSR